MAKEAIAMEMQLSSWLGGASQMVPSLAGQQQLSYTIQKLGIERIGRMFGLI